MISDDARQHLEALVEALDKQSIDDDDGYRLYQWLCKPNIDGYENRDLISKILNVKSKKIHTDFVRLIENDEQARQIYKVLKDAWHYLSVKYRPIKYPADNIGRKCLIKGGTSIPFNIVSFDENTNTTTLSSPRGKILQTKKDLFFCQRETQSIKKIEGV